MTGFLHPIFLNGWKGGGYFCLQFITRTANFKQCDNLFCEKRESPKNENSHPRSEISVQNDN